MGLSDVTRRRACCSGCRGRRAGEPGPGPARSCEKMTPDTRGWSDRKYSFMQHTQFTEDLRSRGLTSPWGRARAAGRRHSPTARGCRRARRARRDAPSLVLTEPPSLLLGKAFPPQSRYRDARGPLLTRRPHPASWFQPSRTNSPASAPVHSPERPAEHAACTHNSCLKSRSSRTSGRGDH